MKTATIHELKQELLAAPPEVVTELCLRLAKFKKENKELLTYLLLEAHDEAGYIGSVKTVIDEQFEDINFSNLYFVKKSLRKIARTLHKYCRYTGSPTVTVELLMYFCRKIKNAGIPLNKNTVITNLYNSQLQKINKSLAELHEDLQYDYSRNLASLDI